jgi:hypothetical protein
MEPEIEKGFQAFLPVMTLFLLAPSASGHVDVVEWLRSDDGFDYSNHFAFEFAAICGETSVLIWAESKGLDWYTFS